MSAIALKHCIVVTCFDPNQPGFLDFSYRLVSLSKEYQLTVISQSKITQHELMLDHAEYQVFSTGKGKVGWIHYLFKCAMFIRQQKPAVVILLHSAAAPIALMLGSIPTCLYWNEHPTNLIHLPSNFSPLRRSITLILHALVFWGARKANLVMPIGEEHQDDLILHKVLPSKIKMLYMGVSEAFFNVNSVNEIEASLPIQLIYVGTVSEQRGRDVMLYAMESLAKSRVNVFLTIVGADATQISYCENKIKQLNIEKYVKVLGRISGEQVPTYLQEADIGICLWEKNPWYEFNPPTKLFEYLASGLPVLASNIRTHTRYIQDWNNGLIFEYDKTSLANAIECLSKHRNRISSLKNNAKVLGQQYAWEELEPVFLQAIRGLLSAKVNGK